MRSGVGVHPFLGYAVRAGRVNWTVVVVRGRDYRRVSLLFVLLTWVVVVAAFAAIVADSAQIRQAAVAEGPYDVAVFVAEVQNLLFVRIAELRRGTAKVAGYMVREFVHDGLAVAVVWVGAVVVVQTRISGCFDVLEYADRELFEIAVRTDVECEADHSLTAQQAKEVVMVVAAPCLHGQMHDDV